MSKRTRALCGCVAGAALLAPWATPGSTEALPGGPPGGHSIQLAAKCEGPVPKGGGPAAGAGASCSYENFQKDLVDRFVASQKDPSFPFWIETADDFVLVDPTDPPPFNKCILESIVTAFAFFNCGDVDGDGDNDQDDCAALGSTPRPAGPGSRSPSTRTSRRGLPTHPTRGAR